MRVAGEKTGFGLSSFFLLLFLLLLSSCLHRRVLRHAVKDTPTGCAGLRVGVARSTREASAMRLRGQRVCSPGSRLTGCVIFVLAVARELSATR